MDEVDVDLAREILRPHWDAMRDAYAEFVPPGADGPLVRVMEVRFDIDPEQHDSVRHFAACRDDGLHMVFAPQIVTELPVENIVAVLAHEFGHALDFLYPAHWRMPDHGPGKAEWIGQPEATKWGRHWARKWASRTRDQVEWAADGIAEAVTGQHITYVGERLLQSFGCVGIERPAGLR